MKRCMIYAVIVLFLLPLCGMAKKRTSKEERTNNHSAFLYYREFGPSVIKGFVYLFFDTLNRSFVLMESNHLGSSFAEYGACRINGDTLVLTPFVYSSTFLYLTDYIRENTNLDDEQIEKELDLLGENNSSDTVRSLYNEWCSLRFKPIDVPVFRSKKESINLCLDPDKFSEYRYIMKGRKLINITAKEIKLMVLNRILNQKVIGGNMPPSFIDICIHYPVEKRKSMLEDCQLDLSKALFNGNCQENFWKLFENIYQTVVENPSENVEKLYRKFDKSLISRCEDFNVFSLKYFIAIVKDGIEL